MIFDVATSTPLRLYKPAPDLGALLCYSDDGFVFEGVNDNMMIDLVTARE